MTRKIRVYCELGMYTREDRQELPDDWDEMSEDEQEEYLADSARIHMENHVDFGAHVVEE